MRSAALALLAATFVASPLAAQAPPPRPGSPAFDADVERAMRDWRVPGAAIAVVKDGRVALVRGYGVREAGKPDRVDARTRFAIASLSKAFTATAVAMLVDSGRVRWDDPATRWLPGFQLADAEATRALTVRDLLTHRSGLARADLLWYASPYGRDEVLRRVRYLRPTWGLRAHFGYQNIMYLAAGQVVQSASGRTWDDFVRVRLLEPLGMTRTATTASAWATDADAAAAHVVRDDTLRVVPPRDMDNAGPAGAISSTAEDMAKWLRFQLDGGRVDGRSLVGERALMETRTPQQVVPREGAWRILAPESHLLSYGMGWFLGDYRGRMVMQHGGNIDGMSALALLVPEEGLGVVILTNLDGSYLPTSIAYRVADAYLGAPARDWSREVRAQVDSIHAAARDAESRLEAERIPGTHPSLPLDRYAGTYGDSLYGDVKVALIEGALHVTGFAPGQEATLEHWHGDVFRATWKDPMLGRTFVTFVGDKRGYAVEARLDGVATFTRAAGRTLTLAPIRIDSRTVAGTDEP